MDDWYFEANGEAQGPVTRAELTAMLRDGRLVPSTQVWTQAFGEDWFRANETDLLPPRVGPPQRRSRSEAVPATARAASRQSMRLPGASSATPPPTTWVRAIAFLPLLVLALDAAWLLAMGQFDGRFDTVYMSERFDRLMSTLSTGGVMTCAWLDSRAVKKAGLNPERRYLVPFMLLTPVGYFWRRSRLLGTSLRYLWIWLAVLAGSLVVEAVMAGLQP